MTSPMDSKGDERVLDCAEPANGMLPPSPMRRIGFTGLLDMIMYSSNEPETTSIIRSNILI